MEDTPQLEGSIFSIPTQVQITDKTSTEGSDAGSEGVAEGVLTGAGALVGYNSRSNRNNLDRLRLELEQSRTSQAEVKQLLEQFSQNQGNQPSNYERAIQGAREDLTGTTGRARGETYNTEEARRAQARRGVNTPFTQSAWGATDQGVLAPPQVIENRAAQLAEQQAASAQKTAQSKYIKALLSSPVSSAAEWLLRSKLLGALSGGFAAHEGYDAYKSAKEGRVGDAIGSGLSALGGAISLIPTPPTVIGGAALGALPYLYKALTAENPKSAEYDRPVTEEDVAMASRPAYGVAPSGVRSFASRRPAVLAGNFQKGN